MRLTVRLDPKQLRQWHLRLVRRLARRPVTLVAVEWADAKIALPSAVAMLFALERLIHGLPDDCASAAAGADEFAQYAAAESPGADLVIDFCGGAARPGERTWQVTFDGAASEAAAIGALTQARMPIVAVIDAETGTEIVSGRPGAENKGALVGAFDDVLARTATLVNAALDGAAARHGGAPPCPIAASTGGVSLFALKSLTNAVARRLYHLCCYTPHWRVGWRFVDGPDVVDLLAHPNAGWRDLPDDRVRFYADPFPAMLGGRTYLFVEEFDHRLGRGVISVVEFDDSGPIGTPRPVLKADWHLSYPCVFEHRGEMWMVPESSATATIDLYRAEAFPDRWVKEATLGSGVTASDATLFEHNDRWWMLATVRDDAGAHSDALHAWSASDVIGPWRPHERNPILIDIKTARPAGRVVRRGGRLIRPFQDCHDGYGSALGLAEIVRLDDEGFEQRIEAVLRPGPLWRGRRLHTLNRAGRLECIDGSRQSLKF